MTWQNTLIIVLSSCALIGSLSAIFYVIYDHSQLRSELLQKENANVLAKLNLLEEIIKQVKIKSDQNPASIMPSYPPSTQSNVKTVTAKCDEKSQRNVNGGIPNSVISPDKEVSERSDQKKRVDSFDASSTDATLNNKHNEVNKSVNIAGALPNKPKAQKPRRTKEPPVESDSKNAVLHPDDDNPDAQGRPGEVVQPIAELQAPYNERNVMKGLRQQTEHDITKVDNNKNVVIVDVGEDEE